MLGGVSSSILSHRGTESHQALAGSRTLLSGEPWHRGRPWTWPETRP